MKLFKIKRNKKIILSVLFVTVLSFGIFKVVNDITVSRNEEASAVSSLPNSSKVVELRFLNTQRYVNSNNESNVIKTLDNKYVVIDTANEDEGIYNEIYNALVDYQGSEEVTIDYLIISHLHGDHYGNAVAIIQNENVTVKNLVVKYEKEVYASYALDKKPFRKIILSAIDRGIENIYTSSNVTDAINNNTLVGDVFANDETTQYDFFRNHYKVLTEGEEVSIGDYIKINFYNTDDIYTGKECQRGLVLAFVTSRTVVVNGDNKFNGKYVYFDGAEYPNATLRTTDTYITKNSETSGMNRYFYATYKDAQGEERIKNSCSSNPNAYGVLVSVRNNNDDKYVYYANDLENNGYGIFPEDGIYGEGYTTLYDSENIGFDEQSHSFTGLIETYKIPAESNVASSIRRKIGDQNLNNLVIYQQAHHSLNDAPDAVDNLNINRTNGIYAIANANTDPGGSSVSNFLITRSYWYALDEIPASNKMYTAKIEDGASCTISVNGDADCGYEELTYSEHTVEFDANNGNGVITSESCVVSSLNSVCQVNVPNSSPEKEGYVFRGWADSVDAVTAQYVDGDSVILSEDMKLYAVWQQNTPDPDPTPEPTPTPDPDPDPTPDPTPTPTPSDGDDKKKEDEDVVVPNTSGGKPTSSSKTTPNTGANTNNNNTGGSVILYSLPVIMTGIVFICHRYFGKNRKRKFD